MKDKVVVCLLGFLSFFAVAARGQEYSKIDLFGGYSYVRANPCRPSQLQYEWRGGVAVIQRKQLVKRGR